jgi:hypothetical protein
MANKKNRTRKKKSEIIQQTTKVNRKTAIRKVQAAAKVHPEVKTQSAEAAPNPEAQQKSASANRAEGIRLFKVAGRPTQEQCVLVYGERGPRMTWAERAKAGVPAEKFQAALAAKQSER